MTSRERALRLPERGKILWSDLSSSDGGELAAGVSRTAEGATHRAEPLAAMSEVLESQGYEPGVEAAAVVLSNCPFDTLAKKHTALVCGLNRDFVQGVAEGLGCDQVEAHLEPEPGRCCVTARVSPR